ncbi:hypothetical protein VP1G_06519 [Cytospora mali]|uniref:NAD-dependent epimerase/dehydratase domain-containing protein n=1 Tax=Cytospora mali TaxID=578113 RepID=A0A194V5M6_CYTMA|nr:hypothetical protein VP1G_06519 [Valsa mali var. pyri (nom. inval.)]
MAGGLILITGISGFLGYATALDALESGYRVRGVVRKEAQIDTIMGALPTAFHSKVELVTIPDLATKGAFDGVVEGLNGIIHIASPVGVASQDFEKDYFRPSVDITISLLSAAAASSTIERVVITSSVSAYIPPLEFASGKLSKEVIHSDDDFIHYKGKEQFHAAHHLFAYAASKSLALDAAENFVKAHSPPFDVVALLPTFVFGPSKLVQSADELVRGSNAILLGHLLGKPTGPLLTMSVHIDDVAKSHVKALKPSVPAGKYLLNCEETDWSVPCTVVKEQFPEQFGSVFPEDVETKTIKLHVDGSKAEKAFGVRFKSFEEQVKETVEYFLSLLSK